MDPDLSLDMQSEDEQRLAAFLLCASCKDLADNAVDTLCCHALLCSNCLQHWLGGICPACQRSCSSAPNHLARRLIGSQPWRCAHCGVACTRSEADEHNRMCPRQPRKCPAEGCKFAGHSDAFVDHLVTEHGSQLVLRASRLFGSGRDGAQDSGDGDEAQRWRQQMELRDSAVFGRDPSRVLTNVSGKNYCCRPLNGARCDCCDGNCGPRNGCNCADCMLKDLETFHIRPGQRVLVNREGVIARMSLDRHRFHCGRPNMGHDPTTDGFCRPPGNNCHACRQLDRQARDRYASIVNRWFDC